MHFLFSLCCCLSALMLLEQMNHFFLLWHVWWAKQLLLDSLRINFTPSISERCIWHKTDRWDVAVTIKGALYFSYAAHATCNFWWVGHTFTSILSIPVLSVSLWRTGRTRPPSEGGSFSKLCGCGSLTTDCLSLHLLQVRSAVFFCVWPSSARSFWPQGWRNGCAFGWEYLFGC